MPHTTTPARSPVLVLRALLLVTGVAACSDAATIPPRTRLVATAASLLDHHVTQQLGGRDLSQVIAALGEVLGSTGFFFGAGPDPIWRNVTPSEIANTRLGASGAV